MRALYAVREEVKMKEYFFFLGCTGFCRLGPAWPADEDMKPTAGPSERLCTAIKSTRLASPGWAQSKKRRRR